MQQKLNVGLVPGLCLTGGANFDLGSSGSRLQSNVSEYHQGRKSASSYVRPQRKNYCRGFGGRVYEGKGDIIGEYETPSRKIKVFSRDKI